MAWLFLDTHTPGEARFAILEEGSLPKITTMEGRTVGLLPALEKELRKKALRKVESGKRNRSQISLRSPLSTLHSILDGICVVAGPGSFSSVRAGVLDANMIARLLKIPLVGITVDEASDLPVLSHKLFATHHSIKLAEYVAPIYDKEPNITIPKKTA